MPQTRSLNNLALIGGTSRNGRGSRGLDRLRLRLRSRHVHLDLLRRLRFHRLGSLRRLLDGLLSGLFQRGENVDLLGGGSSSDLRRQDDSAGHGGGTHLLLELATTDVVIPLLAEERQAASSSMKASARVTPVLPSVPMKRLTKKAETKAEMNWLVKTQP